MTKTLNSVVIVVLMFRVCLNVHFNQFRSFFSSKSYDKFEKSPLHIYCISFENLNKRFWLYYVVLDCYRSSCLFFFNV